jgi:hypothetical protein
MTDVPIGCTQCGATEDQYCKPGCPASNWDDGESGLGAEVNQALSMSTLDMVTMLAHQRDEARSALDYGGRQ